MALEKINERRRARRRMNLRELVTIAERLDPWRGTDERVRVTAVPKRNNEYRFICSPGTENRALQMALRRAVEAGAEYHDAQYSVAGRGGARAAIEAFGAAIETGRYKFVTKYDVQNCFPSLTLEGIARTLGFPRRVIQNVAMVRLEAMDISYAPGLSAGVSVSTEGLRGVAQGSLVSPTIAHLVLKSLLEHVPASAFKAMIVDDLGVLSRTKADAIAITNALCSAATQLPVGPLRLTNSRTRRLSTGIEFLGAWFQRRQGKTIVKPSAHAKDKFTAKAREILSLSPSVQRDQAYRSLARGFEAQHRLWPDAGNWTALRRYFVEAHLRPDFRPSPKAYRGTCFMVPNVKNVRRVEADLAARRVLLQSHSGPQPCSAEVSDRVDVAARAPHSI